MPTAPTPLIPSPEATRAASVVAEPNNGGNQPASSSGQAVVVTSGPARQVTADNITKLQSITQPAVPINPTDTQLAARQDATKTLYNPDGSVNTSAGAGAAPAPSSSSPTVNADGTPNYDGAVKGISDPAVASQFKSSLQAIDQEVSQAKANLDAAKANAINDPAANALVDSIKAQFETQIKLMKDKNTQFLGKVGASVAAFGGLGPMSQGFLNDEQQRADGRIADIVAKENDAVLKAQIAYQTKNYKALNDAMTAYDKANRDKLTTLNTLLSATNKQVKQQQDEQKINAAAEKQAVALDISKSTNLATGIAKSIADSGLTDQSQIDQYLEATAQEYGITNPDILKSAVEKARQASIKSLAGSANSLSTIAAREKPKAAPKGSTKGNGTDGTYKYAQGDIDAYSGFLNQGGTDPSGTRYNGRGSDGYVDPGAYTAALGDWVKQGGTPAGFASKFPVKKNINPASYGELPDVIRPKAAAAPSAYQL